jgi:hypothetical protein
MVPSRSHLVRAGTVLHRVETIGEDLHGCDQPHELAVI